MIFGNVSDSFNFPIELWLFQVLIILFPMLLFQSYFRKKIQTTKHRNVVLGFLCGISILLCMSAPVSISESYILDFRYIPLILVFLYGSYRMGLILSVMIIAYRLVIIGIDGVYLILFVNMALLTILYFTQHMYKNYAYKGKVAFSVGLLAVTIIIFAIGTHSLTNFSTMSTGINMWVIFLTLNMITMFTSIYIIESLNEMEIIHYEVSEFEKMHLVSQFSISIAQQIQQPISNMHKTLETIQNSDTFTSEHRFEIKNILEEMTVANKVLNDYLLLASDSEKEYRLLNIHEEFDQVLQSIHSYAQMHHVELKYIPSFEKDLYIKGNRAQFQQAILNFIKNGIEAIKPYGVIEIAIHEMLESIFIVIEDNGVGMNKEQINRLGNPMKSLKENGTGLGTMIAYNIIHSMSGKIDVSSKKGKGTTFSIILPKAKRTS
ncbi:ATP-binding protein [Neobacillus sp. D3-1R]|uniref:ATP-binding protein n=1 Tax=Neobacillus sp. D3-1R TaxID=3445778 RepID=UPI003FA01901